MSFKIKPPYKIDNTPIYFVNEDEEGVMGRTNMNGSITINSKISDASTIKKVIDHEMVHVDQIKSGLLKYDDKNIYYRTSTKTPFKKYSRKYNKNSPWEKQAYNNKK